MLGSSLELRAGVDVALEGAVVDIGSVVVQEWHDWLVHAAVPLHVARTSVPVAVHVLVVLMVHWLLAGSPFTVSIWNWGVLWKDTSQSPVHEIWMIHQGS